MAILLESGIRNIPFELAGERNFVAKTPRGLAEFKLGKVYKSEEDVLFDLSKQTDRYNSLRNISLGTEVLAGGVGLLGLLSETNYYVQAESLAVLTIGVLGAAGAVSYFSRKIRECERKIKQFENPDLSLPSIK